MPRVERRAREDVEGESNSGPCDNWTTWVVTPKLGERLQQRSLSQRVQVKVLHIYILYIYIFRKLSVLRNKLFAFCSASVLIQASRGNFKLRFAGKTCDWYM